MFGRKVKNFTVWKDKIKILYVWKDKITILMFGRIR